MTRDYPKPRRPPSSCPTITLIAGRSRFGCRAKQPRSGTARARKAKPLRPEPVDSPFVPRDYVAELEGIEAVGHESASVMVGTAGGKVSVSQLPMRRGDSLAFVTVGTSTGRTCLDQTLLATPGVPEMRECQLLAPKDGTVIGHPSPIFTVTVS